MVKTDDLVLSQSFDGKIVLWALGPNAKLLQLKKLMQQDFLPPVSIAASIHLPETLRKTDILLNNVSINPLEPQLEFLVTCRLKDGYLIKLPADTDECKVIASYDSAEEVI